MDVSLREIYDLLSRLGVTSNYTGFFHTASALKLCLDSPEALLLVTKQVYPDVAKQYNTNWKAVERNIRTGGGVIWTRSRPLLEQLARRPLAQSPVLPSCWLFCPPACCHRPVHPVPHRHLLLRRIRHKQQPA